MTHRMRTSKTGLDLIKSFEGFQARAIELPDGRWTIGHAHTSTARENLRITPADAEAVLREYDLPPVETVISSSVLAPLNQNEFDALVSFVFNIGVSAFLRSNTLGHLNSGQPLAAAHAMSNWRKARINGRLIVVDALVRRRTIEQALFLKPPSGTVAAPSGSIRPVSEAAGDAKSVSLPTVSRVKRALKAATAEARAPMDAKRLTRELGKAAAQTVKSVVVGPKQKPMPETSELAPGPTPDEITRAISALASPDGSAAPGRDMDQTWQNEDETEVATLPPLLHDDSLEDLPPLPDIDYGDADIIRPEVGVTGGRLIDDLEPIAIDPALIEKAEADANGSLDTGALLKNPRSIIHAAIGAVGFVLGGWGLYRVLNTSTDAALSDDGRDAYFSTGGIVVGSFLILLAVYLAFRSGASEV